jgi:hypothetical protein
VISKKAREKLHQEYEILLEDALQAGYAAAAAYRREPHPRQRGVVWLQLDDGRSLFAKMVRERYPADWKHGGRKVGVYMTVNFPDAGMSLAYASAVRDVLAGKGIGARVGQQLISEPGE